MTNPANQQEPITLLLGSHPTRERGMCALEAVAFLAGEAHSDSPGCACTVMASYYKKLNDSCWSSDQARTNAMWPAVLALLNSKADRTTEQARGLALADFAIRTCLLDRAKMKGWTELVTVVEQLSPIVDKKSALEARDKLKTTAAFTADAAAYAVAATDAAAYAADAAAVATYTAAYAAAYAAYAVVSNAAAAADADQYLVKAVQQGIKILLETAVK